MKMMNLLSWKWINGEREIPGRQKVVRGSSVSTLTSHAGLNPRSCTALNLTDSLVVLRASYEPELRVIKVFAPAEKYCRCFFFFVDKNR